MNPQLIWLFIQAIPDLIKLLQALEKAKIGYDTDRKVTDDLKTLHEAFTARDASRVTALFSGPTPSDPGVPGV